MECQSSDSKKLYKVFDGSKRKRTRKKDLDDTNSVATDDSISGCQVNPGRITSGKASLQDLPTAPDGQPDGDANRERESSCSMARSPHEGHRASRSPRRHRHPQREGISLALKAGMASTPRSVTPPQEGDAEAIPQEQDSLIYAFLEEAIKRDKKKHRHSHSRRHEERRTSRDRDASETHDRRHRHRRHHNVSRDREKQVKEQPASPGIDQNVLLETFAKLCAQMNERTTQQPKNTLPRTQSHKSLQCEVASRHDIHEERHLVRQRSHERSRENDTPRVRSQENCQKQRSRENIRQDCHCYEKQTPKYASKMDISRRHEDDRYREYPPEIVPTRTFINHYSDRPPDYRDYDRVDRRRYEDDRRRYCEQKTSRSFDVQKDSFEEERLRRTARSDTKDKRYDDKYYEKPREMLDRNNAGKARSRRNLERCDRNSIVSRDEEFRERDRYSERERDSGLSVADGETSTVSGRSNYLKVVKQEITEQREAMDKMMKLWKELMRCFKGVSQAQDKDKAINENAENVRESAAAQLRLWRECMRRYETVARDVGDTDARLMEEINKQRSEMAEMASMWQECLQRYRDMSNDFNSLKKKLATPESPTRMPAPAPPLVCAEGEGSMPAPQYRIPPTYPQMGPPPSAGSYPCPPGSVLRGRASAPPAWWWGGEQESPRRRSSPESRGSRDRDTRHRHKDARDETRYKGKSSKPSAARSEHRHRKR